MAYYRVEYRYVGVAKGTSDEAAASVYRMMADDSADDAWYEWAPKVTEISQEEACETDWLLCPDKEE